MNDAVSVTDVFRIYQTADGDAPALQGVTLTVAPGELVAIIGPSGSGKSTLLRIIAGDEKPDAGQAVVLGRALRTLVPAALASFRAHELGVIDQYAERTIAPDATSRDAIALQLQLLGTDRATALERADDLLARIGLAPHAAQRVRELSGGQRQRVAVAAAIAHRPKLLLADEPTGELDSASAAAVHALIAQLVRHEGATAILVSHDPAVGRFADRVLTIADGRLAVEQSAAGTSLVVSTSGWVQLPESVRRDSGVAQRVTVDRANGGIVLRGDAPHLSTTFPAPPTTPNAGPERSVIAELEAVTVRYGPEMPPALNALTACFSAGTLTAVTGPSGSGKTTLVNVLCGRVRPSDGICRVTGIDLDTLDDDGLADLRRRVIAVVEQDIGLVPFLTIRENIAFGLALRGRDDDALDDLMKRLGIAHRADQRVERLSAGERQRVALARALAVSPRLLIIDEPTSRLDRASADAIVEIIAGIVGEGPCVVCATHDPALISQAGRHLDLAAS